VNIVLGSLEYLFYVGVISLVLGVGIALIQFVAIRIFRVSTERVWTLRIWPALLVSLGIICLTLPAAVTRFAPVDLGLHDVQVEGERHITLTGWDQKDYSVLARIPDAVVVQMANDDVTDATLKYLAGMKSLRELDLAGAKISDAGLKHLEGLVTLEKLILSRTQITDAGLKPLLDQLPKLKQLDVRETGVTPAVLRPWLKELAGRTALPRVPAEAPAAP
jgi:Leucine Rich repeat